MKRLLMITSALVVLSGCDPFLMAQANRAKKHADEFIKCIASNPVKIGMTYHEVKGTCLGFPSKFSTRTDASGSFTQVIWYPLGSVGNPEPHAMYEPVPFDLSFFAYFKNGTLVSYSE